VWHASSTTTKTVIKITASLLGVAMLVLGALAAGGLPIKDQQTALQKRQDRLVPSVSSPRQLESRPRLRTVPGGPQRAQREAERNELDTEDVIRYPPQGRSVLFVAHSPERLCSCPD